MKQLIIKRIIQLLSHSNSISFKCMRWQIVGIKFLEFSNSVTSTTSAKQLSKLLINLSISENDLNSLQDEQLIELFELIVKRFNICM